MSDAVAAIRVLLLADAAVMSLTPVERTVAGNVPQGSVLPALGITHISTVPISAMDAQAAFNLVTSRVQVTAHGKTYPEVKALLVAVRKACNYKRGVLAGVSVVSIVRDTAGPDMEDGDAGIYMQTIDFKVTFHEPN